MKSLGGIFGKRSHSPVNVRAEMREAKKAAREAEAQESRRNFNDSVQDSTAFVREATKGDPSIKFDYGTAAQQLQEGEALVKPGTPLSTVKVYIKDKGGDVIKMLIKEDDCLPHLDKFITDRAGVGRVVQRQNPYDQVTGTWNLDTLKELIGENFSQNLKVGSDFTFYRGSKD